MSDRKSAEYIARSERAEAEIRTWPMWMQRNIRPTRLTIDEAIRQERARIREAVEDLVISDLAPTDYVHGFTDARRDVIALLEAPDDPIA